MTITPAVARRISLISGVVLTALLAGVLLIGATPPGGGAAKRVPAPTIDEAAPSHATTETAVLAGGCYWGVQGVFQHVKGVAQAVSGYTGGSADTATYGQVGSGRTGHAESVRITYDPQQIRYGELLQIYFSVVADPTEIDRQGPDTGPQYRSALFPRDATQQRIAAAYIAQLGQAKVFGAPIATRIEMDKTFYPAEADEQDFLARNPDYGYIVVNDLPKIERLRELFPQRYREQPVLVAARAD